VKKGKKKREYAKRNINKANEEERYVDTYSVAN
jgi:hypothetical protein